MVGREYKFTFEDGSEALAHHGVKGMKWGVWNAETKARYTGTSSMNLASAGGAASAGSSEDEELKKRVNEELEKMKESYKESTGKDPSPELLKQWTDNVTKSQEKKLRTERYEQSVKEENERIGYTESERPKKQESKTTNQQELDDLDKKYDVTTENGVSKFNYDAPVAVREQYEKEKEELAKSHKTKYQGGVRHSAVYRFVFEDGSEALAHYGVKGMRRGMHLFGDLSTAIGGAASIAQENIDKARLALEDAGGAAMKGLEDLANDILNGNTQTQENSTDSNAESSVSGSTEIELLDPGKTVMPTSSTNAMTDEQVQQLAYDVIRGDWGNGEERYDRLSDAGYSYSKVQTKVNDIIYGTNDYAEGRNTSGREDRDAPAPAPDTVQLVDAVVGKKKTASKEEEPKKRVG